VGGGAHSAILHYEYNDGPIASRDLVLVDAASENFGFASDITRTWPASGAFTPAQLGIYNAVLAAQNAALAHYVPGGAFPNASDAASQSLLQSLLALGLVTGDVTAMFAAGVHRAFMPHGLGHFVGLDVHDCYPSFDPDLLQPALPFQVSRGVL
jgi:Xaa-Pro aminopeptidase